MKHGRGTEAVFAAWLGGGATVFLLKGQWLEGTLIWAAALCFVGLYKVLPSSSSSSRVARAGKGKP